jgi:hypothetical protein
MTCFITLAMDLASQQRLKAGRTQRWLIAINNWHHIEGDNAWTDLQQAATGLGIKERIASPLLVLSMSR